MRAASMMRWERRGGDGVTDEVVHRNEGHFPGVVYASSTKVQGRFRRYRRDHLPIGASIGSIHVTGDDEHDTRRSIQCRIFFDFDKPGIRCNAEATPACNVLNVGMPPISMPSSIKRRATSGRIPVRNTSAPSNRTARAKLTIPEPESSRLTPVRSNKTHEIPCGFHVRAHLNPRIYEYATRFSMYHDWGKRNKKNENLSNDVPNVGGLFSHTFR